MNASGIVNGTFLGYFEMLGRIVIVLTILNFEKYMIETNFSVFWRGLISFFGEFIIFT